MGREYDGRLPHDFPDRREGQIVKVFEKVKPEEHSVEVLAALAS